MLFKANNSPESFFSTKVTFPNPPLPSTFINLKESIVKGTYYYKMVL